MKVFCHARFGVAEKIDESLGVAYISEDQFNTVNNIDYFFDLTLSSKEKYTTAKAVVDIVSIRLNRIVESLFDSQNLLYLIFPKVMTSSNGSEENRHVQKEINNILINQTHYFNNKVRNLIVQTEGDPALIPFKRYMEHQNEIYEIELQPVSETIEITDVIEVK